jgi:BolA protein
MKQTKMLQLLTEQLQPTHLEVINESPMHQVPEGAESHFKIVAVSNAFKEASLVQRHRKVYEILTEVVPLIHALSMHLYTVEEWQAKQASPDSPLCERKKKE